MLLLELLRLELLEQMKLAQFRKTEGVRPSSISDCAKARSR